MTSASAAQNVTTGAALAPRDAQAAPNRKAKTTTCKTSLRAIASIMLAGKVCSTTAASVAGAAGASESAAVRAIGTPSPGRRPEQRLQHLLLDRHRVLPLLRPQ